MIISCVGAKELNAENMETVLAKFKDHLVTRNVANEVADQLCDSVRSKLLGNIDQHPLSWQQE